MAEDDWSKNRKRSKDSSSDDSSHYSSSTCEPHQESEKTSRVFDISPQSESKSTLLTPRTSDLAIISIESASCSGLSKKKCKKEVAKGVKRRLWDVDSDQVDLHLDRELKRMHKEETLEKSAKWNFDFERETPLSGDWSWCTTQAAPRFYQSKDITSKFKPIEAPTISKWSSESRPIQTVSRLESIVRPKAIRPSTSKPAAIKITFSKTKKSVKSLQPDHSCDSISSVAILETASKSTLPSSRLDINEQTLSDSDSTKKVLLFADSKSDPITSSPTVSYDTKVEGKRKKIMTLRPRKRQRLERKKSSQLKRFR